MSVLDHLDALDAALVQIRRAAAAGEDVTALVGDARVLLLSTRQLIERDATGKFPALGRDDDDD